MKFRLCLVFFMLLMTGFFASGQDVDPYKVMDRIKKNFEPILDYSADIEIKVDVDFIKMPVKHATMFYKYPDKVKFKSDEFIMLPKKGLDNSFRKILNEDYTALYSGQDTVNGHENYIIKLIPASNKEDIILATWWIDTANYRISRIENNTRKEGTFLIDFTYADQKMVLPSEIKVSFEVDKLKIPLMFTGKSEKVEMTGQPGDDRHTGSVYIYFSNYKINTKLSDELFKEEDKK